MSADAPDPAERYASAVLRWPTRIENLEQKSAAALRAAAHASEGQTIGIGSGSSTYLALWEIGARARREGLAIRVVTSSYETAAAADRLGLAQVPLGSAQPDWGVDGADELDPDGRLIKGRGGALFKEKLLWATSPRMFLAIDESKRVERLGERFPVPVEVDRAAVDLVTRALRGHDCTRCELRLAGGKDGPVITEAGNLILDAWFDAIPHGLQTQLKLLPGVIETGLFEGYSFELL